MLSKILTIYLQKHPKKQHPNHVSYIKLEKPNISLKWQTKLSNKFKYNCRITLVAMCLDKFPSVIERTLPPISPWSASGVIFIRIFLILRRKGVKQDQLTGQSKLLDNIIDTVPVKSGNYRRVIPRALRILGMRVILLATVINGRTQMTWLHSLILKNGVDVPTTLLALVS